MTAGAAVRLLLFGAALVVVAAAAAAAGRASGVGGGVEPAMTVHAPAASEEAHEADPAGLALEEDGYRLVAERAELPAARPQDYVFRIVGPGGEVVRDFDVEHERRLHLIVAGRAPNVHFLHLHPRQRADGAWVANVRLPVAGAYRVFADFTTDGDRRTLGIDLAGVGGPERAVEATSRYEVRDERRGERLEFTVRDPAGEPVELQPYLGAMGHLVVLREGDLAYVHAHAEEDELAFDVPFPSAGRYRLYLQFQVDGRVETVRLAEEIR